MLFICTTEIVPSKGDTKKVSTFFSYFLAFISSSLSPRATSPSLFPCLSIFTSLLLFHFWKVIEIAPANAIPMSDQLREKILLDALKIAVSFFADFFWWFLRACFFLGVHKEIFLLFCRNMWITVVPERRNSWLIKVEIITLLKLIQEFKWSIQSPR